MAVIVKGNQAVLIRFRSVPKLAAPMELSSEQEMVFRHVINGQRIVARQRERVEMLARNGHDTTEAERTLDIFARTLDIFEGDLRRILADELKRATVRRG